MKRSFLRLAFFGFLLVSFFIGREVYAEDPTHQTNGSVIVLPPEDEELKRAKALQEKFEKKAIEAAQKKEQEEKEVEDNIAKKNSDAKKIEEDVHRQEVVRRQKEADENLRRAEALRLKEGQDSIAADLRRERLRKKTEIESQF